MINESALVILSNSVIIFLTRLTMRYCTDTLFEMNCVASVTLFIFIVSVFSLVFLAFFKDIYGVQNTLPVPAKMRIVTGLLQVIKSYATLSQTFRGFETSVRLVLLLEVPYAILVAKRLRGMPCSAQTLSAILLLLFGSFLLFFPSLPFTISPLFSAILRAVINVHCTDYAWNAMNISGVSPIKFFASAAPYRMIGSALAVGSALLATSTPDFRISLQLFPVLLLVAASAVDFANTVSTQSFVAELSYVAFFVMELLDDVLVILLESTISPVRFTTFSESVLSFSGFALAIPGFALYFTSPGAVGLKPKDTEPFKLDNEGGDTETCETD